MAAPGRLLLVRMTTRTVLEKTDSKVEVKGACWLTGGSSSFSPSPRSGFAERFEKTPSA